MSICTAPDCDRPTDRGDLCRAHYEQQRRGNPFKPLRASPGEGTSEEIHLRLPKALYMRLRARAKRERVRATELIRRILDDHM